MSGLIWYVNSTAITFNDAVLAAAAKGGSLATIGEVLSSGFIAAAPPANGPFYEEEEGDYQYRGYVAWVDGEHGANSENAAFVGYGDPISAAHGYLVHQEGRLVGTSASETLYLITPGIIESRGGGDTIYDSAGADTLLGGYGNDYIFSRGGADRVVDGGGTDYVYVQGAATITPTADHANDFFYGGRVDYSQATGDIVVGRGELEGYDGMLVSSSGYGQDLLDNTATLITGSGNDRIDYYGQGWVYSGAGDDEVFFGHEDYGQKAQIDGGAGNDRLTVGYYGGKAIGGAGDDILWSRVSSNEGGASVEFTGGAGHDTFTFDNWDVPSRQVIWDFTVSGPNADTLELGGGAYH